MILKCKKQKLGPCICVKWLIENCIFAAKQIIYAPDIPERTGYARITDP